MPNKPIGNINELEKLLTKEDACWQQRVFSETGVVVLPSPKGQSYWELVSSCGSGDLDNDSEYHWINGKDESSYCTIASVKDLITYIKGMDTYRYALNDINLGSFNKSDLFWAIYYRIILLNRYPDDDSPVYGMKAIEGPGASSQIELGQSELWFRASAVGIDELGVITISLSEEMSLDSVVDSFAEELRDVWSNLSMGDLEYKYDRSVKAIIPKTYDEVVDSINMMCY